MIDLNELLPDDLSDEAAYHVANFFVGLSLAIETRYYKQVARYAKENSLDLFPYNLLPPENNL